MERELPIGNITVVWPARNNHFESNMGKANDVRRCVKESTQPIGCTFKTILNKGQRYML
jgi:hypothetical protein